MKSLLNKILALTFLVFGAGRSFGQNEELSRLKEDARETFLEIGIRSSQFSFSNDFMEYDPPEPDGIYTSQTGIYNSFKGGISIQSYTMKKILKRLTLNYQINRSFDEHTWAYSDPHPPQKGNNYWDKRSQRIELIPGIGKIINYKSFTFKYGLDFPVNIPLKNSDLVVNENQDAAGNKTLQSHSIVSAPSYFFKTNIFTELEYKVFKQFYIELGMSNGIVYSYSNGKSTSVQETFINGQLTSSIEAEAEVKNSSFYREGFNLHLGINYRF